MLFLLGLLLLGTFAVFYWARQNLNQGIHWAEETCRQAPFFCAAPYWLVIAGGRKALRT
jgi:hypothetical protein